MLAPSGLKTDEANDFAKKWHEAIAAAGGARDSALEEAKQHFLGIAEAAKEMQREVAGDPRSAIDHGRLADHAVSASREMDALKSQPARRFVEAEKVEAEAAAIITEANALRHAALPYSANEGEWIGRAAGVRLLLHRLGLEVKP